LDFFSRHGVANWFNFYIETWIFKDRRARQLRTGKEIRYRSVSKTLKEKRNSSAVLLAKNNIVGSNTSSNKVTPSIKPTQASLNHPKDTKGKNLPSGVNFLELI
jgi:hypothetical protein